MKEKNNYIFGGYKIWTTKVQTTIQKIKCILLHIIMISEGSCDTEDWSNDAENSALQSNRHSHRKQLFWIIIIFHYFYCIFDQMNAALVSRRDFQKHSCRQNLAQ